MEALISYTLVFLLCIGSVLVYDSVFPIGGPVRLLFLCIGIVEILLFFVYLFLPLCRFAPLLTGCGLFLFFLLRRESVILGLKQCANEAILKFNVHFGSQAPVFQDIGENVVKQTAVYFLALLFLWWFVEALFHLKNVVFLSLPPLILICGELLVGRVPGEIPLLMTAGAFFALLAFGRGGHIKAGDGMAAIRWKTAFILALSAGAVFFFADRYAREGAERMVEMQDEVLSYQFALEKQIAEYAPRWLAGQSPGQVSNKPPRYDEKEVISITSDKMPAQNVYLRGYVGDTYRNGNWTNRSQAEFEDKISETLSESNKDHAGSYILNLFYRTQVSELSAGRSQLKIHYLDTKDDYAYLPYLTNLDNISQNGRRKSLLLNADAMIYREGADTLCLEVIVPYELLRDALTGMEYQKNMAIEGCYSEYLSQYLRVPNGLSRLRELGNELRSKLASEHRSISNSVCIAETAQIQAASLVREALFQRADYSLELDRLPFGEDVVEYFLFDSKKGFCEHYASAGVLLLRMMGIPARYVSGYVVKPDEFVRQGDREYRAKVLDSAAHAWVEVFIGHVGWVPVEMTEGSAYAASGYEGYDSDFYQNLRQDAGLENAGGRSETDRQPDTKQTDTAPETEETDRQEEGQTQPDPEGKGQEIPDTEKKEDSPEKESLSKEMPMWKGMGGKDPEKPGRFSTKKPVVIGAVSGTVLFTVLIGTVSYRKGIRRKKKALKEAGIRKRIENSVADINRLLRKKGILKPKGLDDRGYKEALRKGLSMIPDEELQKYFLILERMAYGNEEPEEEDAACCHRIYKRIRECL